ncbi:MAG: hypothetical protein ACJ8KU_07690 [Chthoniobacterales bacterium]
MRCVHFVGLLLLASCVSPAGGHARRQLIGEWRYADRVQRCQYRFAPDDTFAGEVAYRGKRVSQFAGRWSVRGDKLLYRYTSDALGRIAPGSTDSDRLLAVAENYFEIEAADGSRRRYERVR